MSLRHAVQEGEKLEKHIYFQKGEKCWNIAIHLPCL